MSACIHMKIDLLNLVEQLENICHSYLQFIIETTLWGGFLKEYYFKIIVF